MGNAVPETNNPPILQVPNFVKCNGGGSHSIGVGSWYESVTTANTTVKYFDI